MSVEKAVFGALPDGRRLPLYLESPQWYDVGHHALRIPDYPAAGAGSPGELGDVILGHRTWRSTLARITTERSSAVMPTALVGLQFCFQTARPIACQPTDGPNTLHGGPGGYHQVLWEASVRRRG